MTVRIIVMVTSLLFFSGLAAVLNVQNSGSDLVHLCSWNFVSSTGRAENIRLSVSKTTTEQIIYLSGIDVGLVIFNSSVSPSIFSSQFPLNDRCRYNDSQSVPDFGLGEQFTVTTNGDLEIESLELSGRSSFYIFSFGSSCEAELNANLSMVALNGDSHLEAEQLHLPFNYLVCGLVLLVFACLHAYFFFAWCPTHPNWGSIFSLTLLFRCCFHLVRCAQYESYSVYGEWSDLCNALQVIFGSLSRLSWCSGLTLAASGYRILLKRMKRHDHALFFVLFGFETLMELLHQFFDQSEFFLFMETVAMIPIFEIPLEWHISALSSQVKVARKKCQPIRLTPYSSRELCDIYTGRRCQNGEVIRFRMGWIPLSVTVCDKRQAEKRQHFKGLPVSRRLSLYKCMRQFSRGAIAVVAISFILIPITDCWLPAMLFLETIIFTINLIFIILTEFFISPSALPVLDQLIKEKPSLYTTSIDNVVRVTSEVSEILTFGFPLLKRESSVTPMFMDPKEITV